MNSFNISALRVYGPVTKKEIGFLFKRSLLLESFHSFVHLSICSMKLGLSRYRNLQQVSVSGGVFNRAEL